MAEAAKCHLRECKVKAGNRVHVNKTFFYSDANANEKFYGMIIKVLPIDNITVKWDVDNTPSIVSPQDVSVVTNDPLKTDTGFTSTEKNNAESEIVKQKISNKEDTHCLRKRKNIKYNNSFDEVDENDTPDSIEHDKATEPCPGLKSVSTEIKKEHKT